MKENKMSTSDREFLIWIHDRLVHVYGENELYGYMHKLRSIIATTPASQTTPNVDSCNSMKELLEKLKEGDDMTLPKHREKKIKITGVTVYESSGMDKVVLKTDLVSPIWNPTNQQNQSKLELDFDVSKGGGVDYVREIFGIEPKAIRMTE